MPLSSVLGAQSLVKPGVCTSSTRPASPFEGQTIYETDTDLVKSWNGSSWITVGPTTVPTQKVLQVVSTAKTDTFSTANTTFTDVTGLTATITPSSTSNKVLVIAQVAGGCTETNGHAAYYRIGGGNAATYIGGAASSRVSTVSQVSVFASLNNGLAMPTVGMVYLDSPSTTSATTYAVQIRGGNGATAYVNRSGNDGDFSYIARGASSITVMEISG